MAWFGLVLVAWAGSAGAQASEDARMELPDAPSAARPTSIEAVESSSSLDLSIPQAGQKPGAPSLSDLGMTPEEAKADPDLQKKLDRRTHDLKVHQRLGLITLVPLAAACITSGLAPPDPKNGNSANSIGRDVHVSLGSLSVVMYGATAYYAIKAPRIGKEPARGGIKLHKYLIYIHAPGMVLTPILGAMAFNQAASGQKVTGIASAHGAVAWTTVATYTASIIAVSWPIHLHL